MVLELMNSFSPASSSDRPSAMRSMISFSRAVRFDTGSSFSSLEICRMADFT